MDIKNLITFVQVAELSSFTKAARALDYSQSTISFQIKQLENELGCLLFERVNHTLTLTQQGREFLVYAQKVSHLTDEFRQSLIRAPEVTGHVHIVTPDSVCEAMLTDNYADFYRRYPGITLKFSTADTDSMLRMLSRNEADIMMTLDSHVYLKDYVIAKEARMDTHFVVGASSPLAHKKDLLLQDILNFPFILTEKGMGYRRVLDEMLAKRSIAVQPVLEVGRTDVITTLLEAGDSVSFLPDFVTRKKVEEGKLCRLQIQDAQADIWQQLIHHRNKWISQSLETFIQYVMSQEFNR